MNDAAKIADSDINPVQKIVEALVWDGTNGEPRGSRIEESIVENAIGEIVVNPSIADQVLTALFPNGIPNDDSFYDRLADLTHRLGYNISVDRLNGMLWGRAFSKLEIPLSLELLDALAQQTNSSFFYGLRAFPCFLSSIKLPATYLSCWILAVRKRLGDDLASGGFWLGLQSLVTGFPMNALEVVRILSSDSLDENRITIAANLLGNLRAATPMLSGLQELVQSLRDHQHVDRRLIYHRSCITMGLQRPLTEHEFSECIGLMSKGTKEEINEGFSFLRILLPLASTSDESFLFGVRWLHGQTTSDVSDYWKHFLISLTSNLHDRWKVVGEPAGIAPLTNLVRTILPIRDDHKGTWDELEALLVFFLQKDSNVFRTILFDLAISDAKSVTKRLRSRREFNTLKGALIVRNDMSIVVDGLLSGEDSLRHLGFSLFESLGLTSLTDERIGAASDDCIALLIFSFQLEPFYDSVIARFLLALEPRVSVGSKQLQELFISEVIYQCKNLPGGCLEMLKAQSHSSSLVRDAVDNAEKYFTGLRPCFNSAINSMGIPGLERAARVKAARQSREMRIQMKEVSVFTKLCSTTYTLYGGTKWQTFHGGKLGQVSEMQQFSHSAEFPRMPGIDPEGVAIRRHHASVMIKRLLAAKDPK